MPDPVFANIGKLLLATQIYDMHRHRALRLGRADRHAAGPGRGPQPGDRRARSPTCCARNPDVPVRQAHRGGALHRGPDRLLPGRLVFGDQPARRRLAGGDEAGDLAQLSGRQQGRAGRAPARARRARTIRTRAITANRQPGRCCDTGCTPPGQAGDGRPAGAAGAPTAERHPDPSDEIRTMATVPSAYAEFHRRSLDDRDAFWAEQARLIDWERPFETRLRRQPSAVRALVRRRPDQPVPQRGRPAPRGARRPAAR